MKDGVKKASSSVKNFFLSIFYFIALCICVILIGLEKDYAGDQPILIQALLYTVLIVAMLMSMSLFIYKWDKVFPDRSKTT